MSKVRVTKISVDEQAWLHHTYFHDTTPEKIGIWTSGSQLFDEQHCFLVLICIEEGDDLKHIMKQRICETD
jgi:hypothetical protein